MGGNLLEVGPLGFPWACADPFLFSDDPVHARGEGRFARHANGRVERGEDESIAIPPTA